MISSAFAVRASLITSLLLSGVSFAQTLPDEVNHPQYLRIYESLEAALRQKIDAHNKLVDKRDGLSEEIRLLERDRASLPTKNAELQRKIDSKGQILSQVESEILGLEALLGEVVGDLQKADLMIQQLRNDSSQEYSKNQALLNRKNQILSDVAALNARLQKEIREENQSVEILNRLNAEWDAGVEQKQKIERERTQLSKDVERFKVDVVRARAKVNQNEVALKQKRPQLTDTQTKLQTAKSEIVVVEGVLSSIDSRLTPKRTELNSLRAELAKVTPEVTKLEADNKTLQQKISANEAKIKASGVAAQVAKKNTLENEVSANEAKMDSNTQAEIRLSEKIKPTLGKVNELMTQLKKATAEKNVAEMARLKKEIAALNATIAQDQKEIQRLRSESESLGLANAAKKMEIENLAKSIALLETQNSKLQDEIDGWKSKIGENDKKISEIRQSHSALYAKISLLENEVKAIEAERDPQAKKLVSLKAQESQLTAQVSSLTAEIKRLDDENKSLGQEIVQMDKAIVDFPQNLRRLENNLRQIDQTLAQKRTEIDREQKLLQRIRQDRVALEIQTNAARDALGIANQNLADSDRLLGLIQKKLGEEIQRRDALAKYNQDSIRKLDGLKSQKNNLYEEITRAQDEIYKNEDILNAIDLSLPKKKSELAVVSSEAAAAEGARSVAQKNADDANVQYQNRLALFQKYLAEAQGLGEEKASIAVTDGEKVGSVDAKTTAQKLGSESASVEAKWEALKRGYVRGEIAGYAVGFDLGVASTTDASKGEEAGLLAGAKRAQDEANLVIKPQAYLEEFERRLQEDVNSEVRTKSVTSDGERKILPRARDLFPELTSEEWGQSSAIISSLDSLINQSELEISQVKIVRKKLAEAKNVYVAPQTGPNATTANCSGAYKGVREFVDACKGSYVIKYLKSFTASHEEAYKKSYASAFNDQVQSVLASEINRLYPGYFKEASEVGKGVGLAAGKKEIYQQSFDRAEGFAYGNKLPGEVARVEAEAVQLVQDHLKQNGTLTVEGEAKLSTENAYGISPGAAGEVKLLVKNVGSVASFGNSLVKVTEVSSSVVLDRKEAPLARVEAKTEAELAVFKLNVSDNAKPGSKLIVQGEITHPGNHYTSSRVESFRVESILQVNPSVATTVDYDKTPRVAAKLFGSIKVHEVAFSITPKFAGVDDGYTTNLEEVGTDYFQVVEKPSKTEALGKGVTKKLSYSYKLSKNARGKTLTLRLKVSYKGQVVSQQDLLIRPE